VINFEWRSRNSDTLNINIDINIGINIGIFYVYKLKFFKLPAQIFDIIRGRVNVRVHVLGRLIGEITRLIFFSNFIDGSNNQNSHVISYS
jgi:hypothetical protein